ncbi:unnamed protein product, partial [Iphiclides podalirius]
MPKTTISPEVAAVQGTLLRLCSHLQRIQFKKIQKAAFGIPPNANWPRQAIYWTPEGAWPPVSNQWSIGGGHPYDSPFPVRAGNGLDPSQGMLPPGDGGRDMRMPVRRRGELNPY